MAKKNADWTQPARQYAGKNQAENLGSGKDMHVDVFRPFIVHPGGRSFDEQWGRNIEAHGKQPKQRAEHLAKKQH